jgi:predicted transcriptional regulator
VEEVTEYNAIVTQSDPGWSIYVPEVDRHTYAAHLREIEPMARDLVQVMTDRPIEDITVAVHLPADLAEAITAMRQARDAVTAAENAARETQQAAATVLRNAGAPLRDIAAALGVSHQRVHQILEEADATRIRHLEQFRHEVEINLENGALADFELPVTGNDGSKPIVVALADELVSTLTERIQSAGGYANVFVKDGRRVRFVSLIEEACAIGEPDDTMVGDEAPRATSTIGMLLDYVERQPNGVTISAMLGHPACARDARQLELAYC